MKNGVTGRLLRCVRIMAAVMTFSLMTGLFVDYGMSVPAMASWLSDIQLFPAAMAFAFATFVSWLIVTLIFGRLYCSVACPLGVFQDICARLPRIGKRSGSKWDYHYSPPKAALRNMTLFVVVLSILLGISAVTSLLDPYSIFGRFSVYVIKPVWGWILNQWSALNDTPPVRIAVGSMLGTGIAVVTMSFVGAMAFFNGRTFCNSVCPVGTTLGFVSRYSIFRIDINTDKCVQCRHCEHLCKASCIDLLSHVVDTSRCVVCFDCITDCPNDAIHYTYNRHQLSIPLMQRVRNPIPDSAAGVHTGHLDVSDGKQVEERISFDKIDRRRFLAFGAVVAAAPVVSRASDVVKTIDKAEYSRAGRLAVTPPGVHRRKEFLDRCTACGLCISHCPQRVLKASFDEYGLLRALHPVKDYDASWCVYDCTRCTELCPSGALNPLTVVEKHRSRVGIAKVNVLMCLSNSEGINCGVCSRRCPTGAISMNKNGISGHGPFPVVDHDKCIGCGACQYVCPARPKAIIVNGLV